MPDVLTNEPAQLRAGDTWRWRREDLADYPAPTWTLKYRLKNAAGGQEITAAASGAHHEVNVAAATTANYAAGRYQWVAWVEAGAEKYTVDSGEIQVLTDLRAGGATAAQDTRTHARKVLDALESLIEGKATHDVASYSIAGRALTKMSATELLQWRDHYRQEVRRENAAAVLRKGGRVTGNKLFVRQG